MAMDKQGMQGMMRGKGGRKGWTRWIQKQNFGRGEGGLTGGEKIMVLDGGRFEMVGNSSLADLEGRLR